MLINKDTKLSMNLPIMNTWQSILNEICLLNAFASYERANFSKRLIFPSLFHILLFKIFLFSF